MKLILIYGAEATGKLTVAKALAEATGFKLFHNHVSIDLARTLFDFDEPGFADLVWDARALVFEYAAKADLPGLIFTWAYSHPDFEPYLQRMRGIMDKYEGEICFVYLWCTKEALRQRVLTPDRGQVGKINSVERLEAQWERKNYQVIPGSDSLVVENTELSPEAVVAQIIGHYKLLV